MSYSRYSEWNIALELKFGAKFYKHGQAIDPMNVCLFLYTIPDNVYQNRCQRYALEIPGYCSDWYLLSSKQIDPSIINEMEIYSIYVIDLNIITSNIRKWTK